MYVPTFQGLAPNDLLKLHGGRTPYPFDAPDRMSFYRARNAIYHLFHALRAGDRKLTVLVPDYNSGNEVLAMRAAGVSIRYYPVGADGAADPREIEQLCGRVAPDVLYVIHYLGWPQPMRELAAICRRRGMLLVEDCALALLSELDGQPLGSFGDWAVFCLYKTLPVPNGALLVQNTMKLMPLEGLKLRRAGIASVAGRTAELLVQRVRSRINGVGATLHTLKRGVGRAAGSLDVRRSSVGDIGFTMADVDLAMSRLSARLLHRLDFDAIRRRRVENFGVLADTLRGHDGVMWHNLPDGVCPLFFPLLVPNKRAAAEALRRKGVQALEFWNHGAEEPETRVEATTQFLRAHLLALPLHQDLTPRHMSYVGDQVTRLNLRMAS